MTLACCLVVNPAAGGGRATRLLPSVTGVLDDAGVKHQVCASASLEHAKELAVAAAGRGEVAVAVGGDGMVGALAGAVAGADGVFGIIPAGRGNDFARTLGIPFGLADAARLLAGGRERRVDLIGVGRVGAGGAASAADEVVVAGSVYLGIPAVAAELASRSRVPGGLAYPVGALRAVFGWRAATFRLELEGGPGRANGSGGSGPEETGAGGGASVLKFSGSAVVVANSRYFGAGMMVAPQADASDGLLDLVFFRDGPKNAMIRGLVKIKHGTHVSMAQVGTGRAAAVTVMTGSAMPGGADGETLACARPLDAGASLRIRVLPGALRIIS
ncbi:MAG TPA: diacylglycerol kinase family protein [Streptosporangiaceae bacterium]|jgi:diacylglycerol kinase family enzyme